MRRSSPGSEGFLLQSSARSAGTGLAEGEANTEVGLDLEDSETENTFSEAV